MHSADKLVLMVNQIVRNLAIQGDEKAVALAADHMHKYWEPRMRTAIRKHVQSGAKGLSPLAVSAVQQLENLQTVESG
jgi:formate dehydrogenase subunit delta